MQFQYVVPQSLFFFNNPNLKQSERTPLTYLHRPKKCTANLHVFFYYRGNKTSVPTTSAMRMKREHSLGTQKEKFRIDQK